MIGGERELVGVGEGTLDDRAADGVGPVEDDERNFRLRGLLDQVSARRDVGVEARAHVLDVEHQGVQVRELRGRRAAAVAIERDDREPDLGVHLIGHAGIGVGSQAVLGREEAHDRDSRLLRLQ